MFQHHVREIAFGVVISREYRNEGTNKHIDWHNHWADVRNRSNLVS
jgi:hypothetical protein